MSDREIKEQQIIGPESIDRVSQKDRFWLSLGKIKIKEAQSRQEDGAKQLIVITSILQAVYFASIPFTEIKNLFTTQNYQTLPQFYHWWLEPFLIIFFISPVLLWLISLFFAVRVLVPEDHFIIEDSPTDWKDNYKLSVKRKSRNLQLAHKSLVIAFGLLAANIIVVYFALI